MERQRGKGTGCHNLASHSALESQLQRHTHTYTHTNSHKEMQASAPTPASAHMNACEQKKTKEDSVYLLYVLCHSTRTVRPREHWSVKCENTCMKKHTHIMLTSRMYTRCHSVHTSLGMSAAIRSLLQCQSTDSTVCEQEEGTGAAVNHKGATVSVTGAMCQ